MDPASVAGLRDADGRPIAAVLAENGVELERVGDSAARRAGLGAYVELHIEQGPRMEAEGLRVAAVTGCAGVERLRFEFRGQASHAGTTPMAARRDAGLAAAEAALAIEAIPEVGGGVATTGELRMEPGIPSAVAGRAVLAADLRHPEPEPLARMLAAARERCAEIAARRGCELGESPVFRIEPIRFDTRLVFVARAACAAVAGEPASLASGALHDAAEVARVLPAAMVFAPSRDGISHAREEDTEEADLQLAIGVYAELAARLLEGAE
jgi:N-carbamoyl-L-amino-acid hydrolase